jgi:sporulation protein YlmC with PRC-barrel domain
MPEERVLNVDKDLRGMSVLKADDGVKMGEVSDAVIHPDEGKMLGIIVRTPRGEERILLSSYFFIGIGVNAVMADAKARFEEISSDRLKRCVPALGAIVGTNLVTEKGRLIGRVNAVHISTIRPYVIYHIVESTIQRFLGGGFFIPADVVYAYSPDGVRMMVPADLEEHYGFSLADDAMAMWEKTVSQKQGGF